MRLLVVQFFCLGAVIAFADMTDDEKLAFRNGAIGRYVYRVVDDEGDPVTNAIAHVWFRSYGRPQDRADWVILTDTNGMFTAEHRFNEKFSVGIDKEGYYHTHDEVNYFAMPERPVKDGKWQPYGEVRTVVLKKIKSPIEINRHSKNGGIKIPAYGKWLGFDFNCYSFVVPYGDGKKSDVLLRFELENTPARGYHVQMEVSFTNNACAGAYTMKNDSFSEFKSVYFADTNACYKAYYVFSYNQLPGKPPTESGIMHDEYLVYRTRTTVDGNGRLKTAHYGRLGTWDFVGPVGMTISRLTFNPTPNDTNLEDAEIARKSRLRYKQRLEFERQRKAKVK